MGRAGFLLLALIAPTSGTDEIRIPQARAPRVYTEPHMVQAGDDWYWLRFPTAYSSRCPAPVAILLHGREESETDQARALIHGPWAAAFQQRGFIVAAPGMMRRHRPTWVDAGPYLTRISRHLRRTYAPPGIALAGWSAGARAAVEYGFKNPWDFDAVLALGGGMAPKADPDARELPLFIGVGSRDETCLEQVRAQAEELRRQGFARLTYREYPTGHALSDDLATDGASWSHSLLDSFRSRQDARREHARRRRPECQTAEMWAELAEFCSLHRLADAASDALRRAFEVNPMNERARLAAGHLKVGHHWLSPEDLERAPVLPDGREILTLSRATLAEAARLAERDLLSPDPEVRAESALALRLLAIDSSLAALVRALRTETDRSLLPALQEALLRQKPKALAAALQKWAGDAAVELEPKAAALEILERLGGECAVSVVTVFYFTDPAARPAARCILANFGEPALARLGPILADRDPENAALAAAALGEMRLARAAPMLIRLLAHADDRVKAAARTAILKTGKRAAPELVAALDSPERACAAELLRAVTGESFGPDEPSKWQDWLRKLKP